MKAGLIGAPCAWPVVLRRYPNLTARLVDIVVVDDDLPLWVALQMSPIKRVVIRYPGQNWGQTDAFPGLRRLTISEMDAGTNGLFTFPFRDLKEISVSKAILTLEEQDFGEMRELIRRHQIKITIDTYLGNAERTEVAFWRSVDDPQATVVLANLYG